MGFMDNIKKRLQAGSAETPAPAANWQTAATTESEPTASGSINLTKGNAVSLSKGSGGCFTLITKWGEKDYDLYALVEYTDGHVETVSCFGTMRNPKGFSLKTDDNAVVHVSGDKTAYGQNLPQEVMSVRLNPQIRCVVPVVYSAKNSGTGSFRKYRVDTFVIPGTHKVVPQSTAGMVEVLAVDANPDNNVYTFVPAIIDNSNPNNPQLIAVELYSRPSSEFRPTVKNGVVRMDSGEENGTKRD